MELCVEGEIYTAVCVRWDTCVRRWVECVIYTAVNIRCDIYSDVWKVGFIER
jgi:hypothetical protein